MSLYVDIAVNYTRLCGLVITRTKGDEEPDSYNTYTWRLMEHSKCVANGETVHRYGDGALALIAAVTSLAHHAEKDHARNVVGAAQEEK